MSVPPLLLELVSSLFNFFNCLAAAALPFPLSLVFPSFLSSVPAGLSGGACGLQVALRAEVSCG